MEDSELPKGVLDNTLTETYLSLAVQERLLEEEEDQTDRYLRRYETAPLSQELKQAVLEQVVLTPQVISIKNMPVEYFSGPLMERKGLIYIPPPVEYPLDLASFSRPMVDAMLRSRGYNFSEEEFAKRVTGAERAFKEREEFIRQTGKEPPNLLKRQIQKIFKLDSVDDEYTSEEYEEEERRSETIKLAAPIFKCTEEYLQLVTVATKEKALIRIPTSIPPLENTQEPLMNIKTTGHEDIALLRVVATGLGKLTFRNSLKESLDLAEHPNTQALREQLARWKESLQHGEIDNLEEIQRDVKEATSELAQLTRIKNIGRVVAYLSLPISVVSILSGLPPVLGIYIGLVGLATRVRVEETEDALQWAMFGNT
jgi:hypothetical protein